MKMSWESIMSRICVRDILASTDIKETSFSQNSVDDIMCHAVTLMTSKLLRIYAFNRWGFWDVGGMGGCFIWLGGVWMLRFFFWGVKFAKDQRSWGGCWRFFFHMEHSPTWCLLDFREVAGGGDSICLVGAVGEVGFQDAGSQWGTASSGAWVILNDNITLSVSSPYQDASFVDYGTMFFFQWRFAFQTFPFSIEQMWSLAPTYGFD